MIDKRWLGAFSRSLIFKQHVETSARGSANQVRLAISSLLEMEVLLPSLKEQKEIASILSSLDDKIELNRRTNHTLEQIAQTLFKKYFVDDIDPENLPEGWRWGKLGDVTSRITKGTTPTTLKKQFVLSGINFLKVENLTEFAMEKHLEEFLIKNWKQTELGKNYDIYDEAGEMVGQQYQSDTG